jgi:hypothetical protein
MSTQEFPSELAHQLRAWAQTERLEDSRRGLLHLAEEYERMATATASQKGHSRD